GSALRLLTAEGPKQFHVRGLLEDKGAATSFGGQVAVMFLDAAQVAFGRGTFADRIDVALAPGASAKEVRARLQQAVGSSLEVSRPTQLGDQLLHLTLPLQAALWASSFLALLVGAFLVYNAVGVAVAQRRRELGVLRALGVERRRTTLLFCLEAAALGLPGAGLGLGLGLLLARSVTHSMLDAIDRTYATVPQLTPRVTPLLVFEALTAGVVMAAGAAFWPARRGSALDPVVVLRGAGSDQASPPPLFRMLLGGAVLVAIGTSSVLPGTRIGGAIAISLTVVGAALATPALVIALRKLLLPPVTAALGVPARLGLDYVERTLGRSSVNVLALTAAVSMSVSVGGWLSSFEHSIASWARDVGTADLTVTQGSPIVDRRHVPLRSDAAERVSALPGVQQVQRFRLVDQRVEGTSFRLVATDTDIFIRQSGARGKGWRVVQGAPLEVSELSHGSSILLSQNAAQRLRKKPGDSLTLPTPRGELTFTVRAVIVDYTSELGTGLIDLGLFREHWQDAAVDGLFVYLAKNVDATVSADLIRKALGGASPGGSIFVAQTEEVEKHVMQSVRQTFSYSRGMELMTLVIALMGVVGTMIAAIIDRRREIAMLRAVGATAGQVATAVLVEASFLGLCGAVAGIALGVLECEIFFGTLLLAQTGWHFELTVPWAACARTGGLVVLTSALAGAAPALRAARTELLAATSGE
ncbi:MAG: ABC transporter permease, partial [Polyangiales bacterium]